MSDPVMETSSLFQCFEYTEKLISKKTPFQLDIKLPNGFVFNMSWDDDRSMKPSKHVQKSSSTMEKNLARKQKYMQEKKEKEEELEIDKNIVKQKPVKHDIKCEVCNLNVNSKKQLESHKLQKHKVNDIFSCEYCKKDHTTKTDLKKHMELHKLEENEHYRNWYNSNEAFEERKQKDFQDFDDIEKLLKECEKDMRDEDHEDYNDSDGEG